MCALLLCALFKDKLYSREFPEQISSNFGTFFVSQAGIAREKWPVGQVSLHTGHFFDCPTALHGLTLLLAPWIRGFHKLNDIEKYLEAHPLCAGCLQEGRYTKATVVNHIKPRRGDRGLFWDRDNWQTLCK